MQNVHISNVKVLNASCSRNEQALQNISRVDTCCKLLYTLTFGGYTKHMIFSGLKETLKMVFSMINKQIKRI